MCHKHAADHFSRCWFGITDFCRTPFVSQTAEPSPYMSRRSATLALASPASDVMAPFLAYLALFLLQCSIGRSAAHSAAAPNPFSEDTSPRITFPPRGHLVYNFWDIIDVTYTSPWEGGVNLSANCWPNAENEDRDTDLIKVSFCSPCKSASPDP